MISRFLGLFFSSLGLAMILHNLIRLSPVFIPFSLVIMVIVIILIAALFTISFLIPNELIDRGMNPSLFVIGSGISLIAFLIGIVIAWVN